MANEGENSEMSKDKEGQEEDTSTQTGLSSMISSPFEFVKSFVPGRNREIEHEHSIVESMGDKLKKKRLKTKKKVQGIGHKHTTHDIDKKFKHIGSHRSVVRYIGSNVPMGIHCRGEYLDMIDSSRKAFMSSASSFISTNFDQVRQQVDQVKYNVVPSLADLGQIMWEDINMFSENNDESINNESGITFEVTEDTTKETDDEASSINSSNATSTNEKPKEDSAKITALEDELAKLRAQIAMIVSAQQTTASQPTQVAIVAPTPIMAPPPPPPPPPPLPTFQNNPPIKISKAPLQKSKSLDGKKEGAPDMNEVLKGLGKVKLKSVDIERSPGGTPMKKREPRADSNNHADIIARALREKFKNANICDSPERSVNSPESSFTPTPPRKERSTQPKVEVVRPVPVPRPRPRPRTEKKTSTTSQPIDLSYNP